MHAAELFAHHGLDGTTLEDLAGATGIPRATLYYYFAGKEEILTFLLGELLTEVRRAVTTAARGGGTAAVRLEQVVRAHLDVFVRYPMASRAMQFDLGRATRAPDLAAEVDRAFLEPVRELLLEGAADGSLRPVEHPRLTATTVLGAITTVGIAALTTEPRRHTAETVAEVVETVALDGLRAGTAV